MEENREGLTGSQERLLAAIEDFIAKQGIPPTTRELADELDITAASVHEQLARLEKKGYIRRRKRAARSLELIKGIKKLLNPAGINFIRVPLLGRIAAGEPLLAVENCEEEILVDASSIGTGKFFALRIAGDSMVNASINDGDLVIVRRQPVAASGEIVAALLGDEATVKRLRIDRSGVFLMPENERYTPIDVTLREDFKILGKVVSTVSVSR